MVGAKAHSAGRWLPISDAAAVFLRPLPFT